MHARPSFQHAYPCCFFSRSRPHSTKPYRAVKSRIIVCSWILAACRGKGGVGTRGVCAFGSKSICIICKTLQICSFQRCEVSLVFWLVLLMSEKICLENYEWIIECIFSVPHDNKRFAEHILAWHFRVMCTLRGAFVRGAMAGMASQPYPPFAPRVSSREIVAKVRSLVFHDLWKLDSKEQWCEML